MISLVHSCAFSEMDRVKFADNSPYNYDDINCDIIRKLLS